MAAFIQVTDKATTRLVYVNPESIFGFTPNASAGTDVLLVLGGTLVTKTVVEDFTEFKRRVSASVGVIDP